MSKPLNEELDIHECLWEGSKYDSLDETITHNLPVYSVYIQYEHSDFNVTIFTNSGNNGEIKLYLR